jgi:hypothetical protein
VDGHSSRVEDLQKPIPKSRNLRPRASKRAMTEAKDRAVLAESESRPKKSRRGVRASSNAQLTAAG